jgi:hypothetical protein
MMYSLENNETFKAIMANPEHPLRGELIASLSELTGLGVVFIGDYLEWQLTGKSPWTDANGNRIEEGSYHWDNDLHLVQVTELATHVDGKNREPWHKTVVIRSYDNDPAKKGRSSISDSGPYGRLTTWFQFREGGMLDARKEGIREKEAAQQVV